MNLKCKLRYREIRYFCIIKMYQNRSELNEEMNLDKAVVEVQSDNKSCITWVRKHCTLHLFPHNLQHIGTSFGIVIQRQWGVTCLIQAVAQSKENREHHQSINEGWRGIWDCHLFALLFNKVGEMAMAIKLLYKKEMELRLEMFLKAALLAAFLHGCVWVFWMEISWGQERMQLILVWLLGLPKRNPKRTKGERQRINLIGCLRIKKIWSKSPNESSGNNQRH